MRVTAKCSDRARMETVRAADSPAYPYKYPIPMAASTPLPRCMAGRVSAPPPAVHVARSRMERWSGQQRRRGIDESSGDGGGHGPGARQRATSDAVVAKTNVFGTACP